ncbi:Maf-like protein [Spathaspora sp. JA1]|nr:Maf-like protein [Spathaspora sp. JA1]
MLNHPLYKELTNYEIILGSKSPRRQEILRNNLGITEFKILESNFAEDLKKDVDPLQYVKDTSHFKALAILDANTFTKAKLIIACDTIVSCNNHILEKPTTKDKQREFFQIYKQFKEVQVISAVTIYKIDKDGNKSDYADQCVSTLLFNDHDGIDDLVEAYIDSEEGLDVAGGFRFQQFGSLLFNSLQGDYFNVVGLPVSTTFELLSKAVLT